MDEPQTELAAYFERVSPQAEAYCREHPGGMVALTVMLAADGGVRMFAFGSNELDADGHSALGPERLNETCSAILSQALAATMYGIQE